MSVLQVTHLFPRQTNPMPIGTHVQRRRRPMERYITRQQACSASTGGDSGDGFLKWKIVENRGKSGQIVENRGKSVQIGVNWVKSGNKPAPVYRIQNFGRGGLNWANQNWKT